MNDAEQRSMPWFKVWNEPLLKVSPILSDADFRAVFVALQDYATSGREPDGTLSDTASLAYSWLVAGVRKDREKYLKKCAQMEINRNKGKQKTEDDENEDNEDAGDGETVAPAPPVSAAGEAVSHADAPADKTSSDDGQNDKELIYQAKRCGLPTTESDLQTARRLAGEYGCLELNTAMQIAFMQKKSVWIFVEGVLKTRKAERKTTLPYTETEIIKQRARQCGLSTSDGAVGTAGGLVREYGMENVLEAMHIAALSQPTWAYVEGVLKNKRAGAAIQTSH